MLKLPLHAYDEAGRILPPKWLYWLLALGCRDLIVFIFALALRDQTTFLLGLFYPEKDFLLIQLLLGLPFLLVFLLLGFRSKLWSKVHLGWPRLIRPLLGLGFFVQIAYLVAIINVGHWQFNTTVALALFGCFTGFIAVIKSKHVLWMVEDWQLEEQATTSCE